MQNSRCPICRRQADKFINIQIEDVPRDPEVNNNSIQDEEDP